MGAAAAAAAGCWDSISKRAAILDDMMLRAAAVTCLKCWQEADSPGTLIALGQLSIPLCAIHQGE